MRRFDREYSTDGGTVGSTAEAPSDVSREAVPGI